MNDVGSASPRIRVELVDGPIDRSPIMETLPDPDNGAHAWFEGVTRRMTGSRETSRLVYEAYAPMAIQQMRDLAKQAADRFSLRAVAIVHRLGEVPIGEASILIGCSAPHRAGPLAALPWLMDQIKADVAIWKREFWVDGQSEWVHPQ